MNASFTLMVSPTGCVHSGPGFVAAQYVNGGYIRSTTAPGAQSLAALKRRVASGERNTAALKAAAEVHVRTHPECDIVRATRIYSHAVRITMLLAALRAASEEVATTN